MTLHVDIVNNEWAAGYQALVGRLRFDGHAVVVVDAATDAWRAHLLQMLTAAQRELKKDAKDPEKLLQRVHEMISDTYTLATAPHEDERCRFRTSAVLPMKPLAPGNPSRPRRRARPRGRISA